ncbi:hypothetical protein WAI453_011745 [Rhynchosporium graminicola]
MVMDMRDIDHLNTTSINNNNEDDIDIRSCQTQTQLPRESSLLDTAKPSGLSTAAVQGTSEALVGAVKLIDPSKLVHVFSSPRQRALVTLDMLLGKEHKKRLQHEGKITVTESITEWDYGNYEGLTPLEIKESRAKSGLPKWDIWTMGCDGGESAEAVQERLDKLIGEIYELQKPHMDGKSGEPADVLIVAHGHILRAFTKRWLLYSMKFPFTMMMEPGAIGIMSYAHHNVDEPAILHSSLSQINLHQFSPVKTEYGFLMGQLRWAHQTELI